MKKTLVILLVSSMVVSMIMAMPISRSGNCIENLYSSHNQNPKHVPDKQPLWEYLSVSPVRQVALSLDGEHISAAVGETSSSNSYLLFFNKDSSTPLWSDPIGNGGGYYGENPMLAMSLDGSYIVGGTGFWDWGTYNCYGEVELFRDDGSTVWLFDYYDDYFEDQDAVFHRFSALAISSYGSFIVAGNTNNKVYFFDNIVENPLWTYVTGGIVNSVAISGDGNRIVIGSEDHNLYYFSQHYYNTSEWSYTALAGIRSVAMSSDGSYIVAGSSDYNIYFFSNNSSTPLWSYTTGYYINQVAVSSDGNYVAVASADDNIYLFHQNGTLLWSYTTGDHVHSVSISSDGSYIVAGSKDQKVYYFHKDSGTPLWTHIEYAPFNSVAVSSDGNYVVAGDDNGYIYLWDNEPPTVVAYTPIETDVPLLTNVTVTFSETMDHMATEQAFSLRDDGGTLTGVFLWENNYKKMIFIPSTTLKSNTIYTATVNITAKDISGNNLQLPHQWQFTTKNQPPTANFTYTPENPTDLQTIAFADTSTDSDGTIVSWYWEFGDGSTSTSQNPTHQYSSPGTYAVTLTVTDDDNANNIYSTNIIVIGVVNQIPTVTISSPSDGDTVKGTIIIFGTALDSDGIIEKVEVSIDGGGWITVSGTTSWSYPWDTKQVSNGGHTISVRAFDGADYSLTQSISVTVDNEKEGGGFMPSFEIGMVTISIGIGALVVFFRRRDRNRKI